MANSFYTDPTQSDVLKNYENTIIASDPVKTSSAASKSDSILDYVPREYDTFNSAEYHVENLQYPRDLMGANTQYGGNYIIFYINVQKASKVSVSGGTINESDYADPNLTYKSAGSKPGSQIEKTSNAVVGGHILAAGTIGIAKGVTGAVGTALTGDIGTAAIDAAATFTKPILLAQLGNASRETKRLKAAIALHNPNSINVSYESSWSGEDTATEQLKMLRFGAADEGMSVQSFVDSVTKGGKDVLTMGTHKILSEGGMGNLIGGITGQAANSKKEMLFKGIDFRTFQFEYKFAPRSAQELALVENIIKMFKFHMHPEFVSGTGHYLYTYPSEFDILYYNNGGESHHLPRYTSCVLTNMSVNSTPNGNFTAFGGNSPTSGAPTEISISLSFKELATLSKSEIANGY